MKIQSDLNPTLWRTCRMLAGTTRMKLLRQLFLKPGRPVSELARSVNVGLSDASQELRRIQSRGLLQAERRGSFVFYRLQPDPQVASSEPMLGALKQVLALRPDVCVEDIVRIAQGLAHPRRVAVVGELMANQQQELSLSRALGMPVTSLQSHLSCLLKTGWIQKSEDWILLTPQSHPLAVVLLSLVAKAVKLRST